MPRPKDDETLRPAGRAEWRQWLEEHHTQHDVVWLLIRKKRATAVGVTYDEAVEEALCFGWIDGQMRSLDEQSYVLRFSPRRPGSLWSLLNVERAERLIAAGKMAAAGLAQVEEARRSGRWAGAYTSRSSPALPADLQEALAADPAAGAGFARLTNSAQTMYAVWVAEAKRPATRQRRIAEVVRRCQE